MRVVVHGGGGVITAPGSGLAPKVAEVPRIKLGFGAVGERFIAGDCRGGGGSGETDGKQQ
jgi:hypothetical protein